MDSKDPKSFTRKQLERSMPEQHKRFAEYRLTMCKVNAYMKAYPKSTYGAAAVSAHRLLKNPKIKAYSDFLKEDIEDITGISKIRNLNELAKIAYSTIAHYHNTWIDIEDFENLTDDQKAAIESTETETRNDPILGPVVKVKLKLFPKVPAIKEINEMMPGYKATEVISIEKPIEIRGITFSE